MQSEKILHQKVVDSLKQEFIKAGWWGEVQEDVKTRLDWLVENVEEVGSPFSLSFMSLFRWEFKRRKMEGEDVTNPMASYFSTLMGMRISEEAYQCGLVPTRACLSLYDYVKPNDADVAACLMFCHKVEGLEKSGILTMNKIESKTSPSEMAKLLRGKKKKRDKPIQEETITWNDLDTDDLSAN